MKPSANVLKNNPVLKIFDYAALVILVAVGLAIRLYLYRFNDVISVDGIGYIGAARKLAAGDISGLSFYGFYPVLIRLVNMLGPELEQAALLVSVVMGTLLVVPLYLLGFKMFSRTTALIAGIVSIVWSTNLYVSGVVLSQSAYATLALAGMYLVWSMFEGRAVCRGAWAGFFMGLAFLTRTEGFLLFVVMPLVPLFLHRRELHRVWKPVVAYCGAFGLLIAMNMLLVHHYTGVWQLSAKTSSALIDTVGYYLKIPDLIQVPGLKSLGYLDLITEYPNLLLANPLKNLKILFGSMLPGFIWFFVLIGFVSGIRTNEGMSTRLFLLCSLAPLSVIVIFYYVNAGYFQPFLPALLLLAAEGAVLSERHLTGRFPLRVRQSIERITPLTPFVLTASCVYFFVLLISQIPEKVDKSTYHWQDDEGRRDHKNLGLMLKTYLPPGKIMTRYARLAYYSGHEMVAIPNTDLRGTIQTALTHNARFLVLYGGRNGGGRQLDFLQEPLHKEPLGYFSITPVINGIQPGLYKYLVYSHPSSLGVIVYEIVR